MSNLVLVYVTFSSLKEAKTVSEELLNEKLIVCANILPELNSLYLWEGKIDNSCEVVVIMKSRNDQIDRVIEKIEAMHSYDQPAIVIIPIERTNKSFTNWVNNAIDVNIGALIVNNGSKQVLFDINLDIRKRKVTTFMGRLGAVNRHSCVVLIA